MKEFEYTVKDEAGVHARPAGMLVNLAKSLGGEIVIEKGDASANAARLFAVMGLGILCGDTVRVSVTGGDEDAAVEALRKFFEENL